MGQLAVTPNAGESPSIKKLRQIIKDLDNYLGTLGDIGDELPVLASVENMAQPLQKFTATLTNLRRQLKLDHETCKELDNTIKNIEERFSTKKVVAEFSVFLRRLRRWDKDDGDLEQEEELDDLRLKFREHIREIKEELKTAVDNRCYPGFG